MQEREFLYRLFCWLPKTNAGSAPVLLNKFDSAFLQGRSYLLHGRLASSQLAVDKFQTSYCGLRTPDSDASPIETSPTAPAPPLSALQIPRRRSPLIEILLTRSEKRINNISINSSPTYVHFREDRLNTFASKSAWDRRSFIGGSDARVIMGDDEAMLHPAVAGEARRGRA